MVFPFKGKPVVVVHQHGGHFAVFHGLEGDHVVAVHLAEGAQAGQPLFGGFATVQLDDRHGLFLERAAGGHEANLALPLGASEIQHRFGQVFSAISFGLKATTRVRAVTPIQSPFLPT